MSDPLALNRQFGIKDLVGFSTGTGGLTRILITGPAAQGELYLHGAHVTRFDPKDQPPVLFMSKMSHFAAGKPIRGGVPICFPWFGPKAGDPKAPAHGFARLLEWSVASTRALPNGAEVVLTLTSNEETKKAWPADFVARYTVTVTDALSLSFAVTNTGSAPCKFEEALHTYFSIGDIETVSIDGLGDVTYLDKANGGTRTLQETPAIHFTGETDRAYLGTESTCVIHDTAQGRTIENAKSGSTATVVWNPWINKAKAMPDFGDDEWPQMVCVETCNVFDHAVTLNPGATHTITARITAYE